MLEKLFRPSLLLFIMVSTNAYTASYYGTGAYADVGIGLRYDANISRAEIKDDRKEDFINIFSGRYGYQKILNQYSLLNLSADVIYERMNQFKSLNNVQFSGTASYFYQSIPGFFNPWIELVFRLSNIKYNKSNIRDSLVLDSSFKLGKRFTDKLTGGIDIFL